MVTIALFTPLPLSRMLLCPVRGCHLPLITEDRRRLCPRGHSFDIARSGYTNLLQPQERRSRNPGDTAEAVAARRRLHDRGVTEPLLRGIAEIAKPFPEDSVLDAGCGEGFYLGSLAGETGCEAYGVDISIPAVDAAARRYPGCEWIVANADRFIPWAEQSFSLVLSITARMNTAEFRRVLRNEGRLLVALPAPDDLVELRGAGGIVWPAPSTRSLPISRLQINGVSAPFPIWMRRRCAISSFRFTVLCKRSRRRPCR